MLSAELQVLASGSGVRRIIGDQVRFQRCAAPTLRQRSHHAHRCPSQVTRAEFHYAMPGRTFINREVVFVNTGGDWRAEG